MSVWRRTQRIAPPRVIAIDGLGAYTDAELMQACRIAIALCSVLYLVAPKRA